MIIYFILVKGYVYSDIRNACSSLGEQAKAAFLKEYGIFDELEIVVDDVASVLTLLFFACGRPVLPKWAETYLMRINQGFGDRVERLIRHK